MRRGTLVMYLIFVLCSFSYGQSQAGKMKHFIELHEFLTGSGFTPSTEICVKISRDNKKTIALGPFYCFEFKKISGFSFQYEIGLFKDKVILRNLVEPHIFYNLIYRKTTIPDIDSDNTVKSDLGTYTSIEHHIGIGMKINLSKSLYTSYDLGFGTYLGSIKKAEVPNENTGEIVGTNGFGVLVGVRIGYYIF